MPKDSTETRAAFRVTFDIEILPSPQDLRRIKQGLDEGLEQRIAEAVQRVIDERIPSGNEVVTGIVVRDAMGFHASFIETRTKWAKR
jgi:hypothetical protein